jgi:hypothetical protein
MKVNRSRKATCTIMNHLGFGDMLLIQGDFKMLVPKEWIFRNGVIKKYAQKQIARAKAEHNLRKVV